MRLLPRSSPASEGTLRQAMKSKRRRVRSPAWIGVLQQASDVRWRTCLEFRK
jgi:hypothetical protein